MVTHTSGIYWFYQESKNYTKLNMLAINCHIHFPWCLFLRNFCKDTDHMATSWPTLSFTMALHGMDLRSTIFFNILVLHEILYCFQLYVLLKLSFLPCIWTCWNPPLILFFLHFVLKTFWSKQVDGFCLKITTDIWVEKHHSTLHWGHTLATLE